MMYKLRQTASKLRIQPRSKQIIEYDGPKKSSIEIKRAGLTSSEEAAVVLLSLKKYWEVRNELPCVKHNRRLLAKRYVTSSL